MATAQPDDYEQTLDRLEAIEGQSDETLAELKKLRAEHKAYRERYGPWEQAAAGLDENAQGWFLGTMQAYGKADYDTVLGNFLQSSAGLAGGEDKLPAVLAKVLPDVKFTPDAPAPKLNGQSAETPGLTADVVEEMLKKALENFAETQQASAEEERQQAAMIEKIDAHLQELGVDPGSALAGMVMSEAAAGDPSVDVIERLTTAHEGIVAELNENHQAYLQRKTAEAVGEAPKGTQPDAGVENDTKTESKSLDELIDASFESHADSETEAIAGR